MCFGLGSFEVFRSRLENLKDIIGDLARLRHVTSFRFDVLELLVVEVALFFDAFNLLEKGLVLEQFRGQLIFKRLDQVL